VTKLLVRGRLGSSEFFQVLVLKSDDLSVAIENARSFLRANDGVLLGVDSEETATVTAEDVPEGFTNGADPRFGVFGASGRALYTPGT
jgi:hypothetical protein